MSDTSLEYDLSNFEQGQIVGPGKVHENGWRRESLWAEINGGIWHDDAIAGYISYYEKPGTDWKGTFSYYVEATKTYNQPEERDVFVVSGTAEVFRDVDNDQHDLEITHDLGSAYFYDDFDTALAEARRLASDESYCFNV